jgi:hypothetical protein
VRRGGREETLSMGCRGGEVEVVVVLVVVVV